jgi:hypothetical protein
MPKNVPPEPRLAALWRGGNAPTGGRADGPEGVTCEALPLS